MNKLILLLLSAILFAQCTKKPNIIFIVTDDQGAWTTGYSGDSTVSTPNMDNLRSEGMLFENAFCNTPVCSPSRSNIITGRYSSETGIGDYIPANSTIGLDPKFETWPKLVSDAGYTTALIGKWHLGHEDEKYYPQNHGYDYYMGLLKGGCFGKDPKLWENGGIKEFQGLMVDILTDKAIEFIKDNKRKKFALSLHYRAPHAPYLPVSPEDWAMHAETDTWIPEFPNSDKNKIIKKRKEYNASVTSIDRNIGRLNSMLKELGLDENTVVIFTSDHGYNLGEHGVWAKGNGVWLSKSTWAEKWPHITNAWRPNMWETSLRVPFIVKWPNVARAGSKCRNTAEFIDLFPTLCDIAGVKIPEETILRGQSLLPLIKGEIQPDWNDEMYAEYNMNKQNGGTQSFMRMWRTTEWKLVFDIKNVGRGDLYNLSNDPDEKNNLFYTENDPKLEEVKAALAGKIFDKMREIKDPQYDNAAKAYPQWVTK